MDRFPDPNAILAEMRQARQDWINSGGADTDVVWAIIEAFETLDALLLEGGELPEDWKAPEPFTRPIRVYA